MMLAACGDGDSSSVVTDLGDATGDTRSDAEVAADSAGEVDGVGDTGTGDTGGSDTLSDTAGDSTVADADAMADTDAAADTVERDTSWPVDASEPWALGRPLAIASSDGAGVALGEPLLAAEGRAYLALRLGSGSLVADGATYPAPDGFAHALVVRLDAGPNAVSGSRVLAAAYVDGGLDAPEVPQMALCDGTLIVTVNDVGGQKSRILELSADLESVRVAQFAALPNLGTSVKLGRPVCGGPRFVVTLDAVGGAIFTGYDNKSSQFSAEQTMNRTMIVNGGKLFGDPPAAQTVSATGMRIIHIVKNAGQKILYVGEATIERVLSETTTLLPGDQLVYQHDFATGQGGTIASQGFYGNEDVTGVAGSSEGRFAVTWLDASGGTSGDALEVVLTVFSAQGARLFERRAGTWAIDGVSFAADGDVRVVGRYRSLEVLGVALPPVGVEDAFLAVLDGDDGERLRHVTRGWATISSRPVGGPVTASGSAECGAGAMDAMIVKADGVWEVVGVSGNVTDGLTRCRTRTLQAGRAELSWSGRPGAGSFDAWVSTRELTDGLDGGGELPWPSGLATVGPVRGRLIERL